jgi:hypothetical protein
MIKIINVYTGKHYGERKTEQAARQFMRNMLLKEAVDTGKKQGVIFVYDAKGTPFFWTYPKHSNATSEGN